jgi:hypothetical protein
MVPIVNKNVPNDETATALVTVVTSTQSVDRVLCEVSIPHPGEERPRVVLRPSVAQAAQLHEMPFRRIDGFLQAVDGTVTGEIGARDLWLNSETIYLGHGRETTFKGEARDFSKTIYIQPSTQSSAEVRFWISPNRGLTPSVMLQPRHSDDIDVVRHLHDPIALTERIAVQFDQVFDDWYEGETFHRAPRLVARARLPDGDLSESLVSDLDDLLVVAGLPMRKRTVCHGWDLVTTGRVIRHFRGNSGTPGDYHYPSLNFGLVAKADFQPFMARAWDRFRTSPDKQPIRRLIYSAVPADRRALETDTVALFSAIEDYLASYRRGAGLTATVQPETAWSKVENALRTAIKSCDDPRLDPTQRSQLYRGINGLNRPPLEVVFASMIAKQGVYTDDLWPIFCADNGPSIYQIRNRLVHGDFPDSEVFTLSIVNEHLRWLIDRILLGLLGWPVDQSDVSPGFVEKNYLAAREWRALRVGLIGKLTPK